MLQFRSNWWSPFKFIYRKIVFRYDVNPSWSNYWGLLEMHANTLRKFTTTQTTLNKVFFAKQWPHKMRVFGQHASQNGSKKSLRNFHKMRFWWVNTCFSGAGHIAYFPMKHTHDLEFHPSCYLISALDCMIVFSILDIRRLSCWKKTWNWEKLHDCWNN